MRISYYNKDGYKANLDGSLALDKLGRRIHANRGRRGAGEGLYRNYNFRMTNEMYNRLLKKAGGKKNGKSGIPNKIREYIEWGLENDKID